MFEGEAPVAPGRTDTPAEASRFLRLFSRARYFVVVATLGSFLSAVALYVYGALIVVRTIVDTVREFRITIEGAKHLQVAFIEVTDMFLLGTVLFIVTFGLHQLFIQPDLPVPAWLKIDALDQLTWRLGEVVAMLLGVTFLAFAAEEGSGFGLLELGVSVAVVIAAISLMLVVSHRLSGAERRPPGDRVP